MIERIYIGRHFKNDTERLEKLFELYTKMTAAGKAKPAAKATRGGRRPYERSSKQPDQYVHRAIGVHHYGTHWRIEQGQ